MKAIKNAAIIVLTVAFFGAAGATTKQETCAEVSALAQTIMTKRQEGISMMTLINAVSDNKLAVEMIKDAYDYPRYQTPAVQQHTIDNYRDKWALACMQSDLGE